MRTALRRVTARHAAMATLAALGLSGCAAGGGGGSILAGGPGEGASPASLVWPPPPDAARVRFVMSLATPADVGAQRSRLRRLVNAVFGRTESRVQQPYGIAVDTARRVFVTDTRARGVHVFDPVRRRYEFLTSIGGTALRTPTGVAVDPAGNLYIADSELGIVFSIDPSHRERWRTRQRLLRPTGLALNTVDSLLYVVETQGHRVLAYDLQGAEKFVFGSHGDGVGELNFPTNVTVGVDGEVYITDSMNFRVQMFDRQGESLAAFGRHGDAVGDFARPKGIGLDSEGHIYVVEGLYDAVNVYSRAGSLLLSFGASGRNAGEFWLATGLTVDAKDRIYVADSYNSRVQVFQYLPSPPGS